MPPRYALKLRGDRPTHIFLAKLGESPSGWAVPVQRVLTILKPSEAFECASRWASLPRLAARLGLLGH
jgi:hypothetical protein